MAALVLSVGSSTYSIVLHHCASEDSAAIVKYFGKINELCILGKFTEVAGFCETINTDVIRRAVKTYTAEHLHSDTVSLGLGSTLKIVRAILNYDKSFINQHCQELYVSIICANDVGPPPIPDHESRMGTLVTDVVRCIITPMVNHGIGEFQPIAIRKLHNLQFISFNLDDSTIRYFAIWTNSDLNFDVGTYENHKLSSTVMCESGQNSPYIRCGTDQYCMRNGRLYKMNKGEYALPKMSWIKSFTAVADGYAYGRTDDNRNVRCLLPHGEIQYTRVEQPLDQTSHYYYRNNVIYLFYYGQTAPYAKITSYGMKAFGRMPVGDEYYILDWRGLGTIIITH